VIRHCAERLCFQSDPSQRPELSWCGRPEELARSRAYQSVNARGPHVRTETGCSCLRSSTKWENVPTVRSEP
jgi:hypothetical protein